MTAGFFEEFNRVYAGMKTDPDRAVIGEMLAEKYGIRFRDTGDRIELYFLSRPLWSGGALREKRRALLRRKPVNPEELIRLEEQRRWRYNACMNVLTVPGREDVIRAVYMEHWVETDRGRAPADHVLTDPEFLRGVSILKEYLDLAAAEDGAAEYRQCETA